MANDTAARDHAWLILAGCWVVATGASLGSLFFSEVMDLAPCSLCWYQRTFMFPLAVVLLVGLLSAESHRCARYALPLAIGGGLLALYHVLLQAGVVSESMAPCRQGVSCGEVQLEVFGFASIPVLSLIAFGAVTAGLLVVRTRHSR